MPGGGPRPRECGGSDLWNCGYSAWECRQQWHLVCGAADAQPWPEAERPNARAVLLSAAEALRALALCCVRSLQEAKAGGEAGGEAGDGAGGGTGGGGEAGDSGWAARLERQCAALGDGTDPSVLDAFAYRAEARAAAPCHMTSHTDPGLLTLTLASATAGLQARSSGSGGRGGVGGSGGGSGSGSGGGGGGGGSSSSSSSSGSSSSSSSSSRRSGPAIELSRVDIIEPPCRVHLGRVTRCEEVLALLPIEPPEIDTLPLEASQ